MITFAVDDVAPVLTALPTQPLGDLVSDALAVGGDPALPVLVPDGVHPLLSAVARAFADHRPLMLSPDAVWLTIAQGVAQHIRLHAEELRPRLVSHAGRMRLTAVIDRAMPTDADLWRDVVATFHKLLAAEINEADLFECDFTTSTDVEQVAGRVVLLDAYSPYFSMWLVAVCGIPSITLTGTVDDWQKIRDRIDSLAAFGLEKWCRSLAPIADEFVRAAAGAADTDFWRRIYNPTDAYGGAVITGWIARLYPYLSANGAFDRPNELLDLPIGEPRDLTTNGRSYRGPGIHSDAVPATLSKVIVNVNDQVAGDNRTVALHAGLVGVAQDNDGALRPVVGWHLSPAAMEIEEVIDRIVRDHETTAPQERRLPAATPDIVAIYRRIGSASLFGGQWRILPIEKHAYVSWDSELDDIFTFIELADGRHIGWTGNHRTQKIHWIACHIRPVPISPDSPICFIRLVDDPADVPVYGTSLALLLDAALDSGGDITHLETTRLAHLDTAS
jgi:hypothetical protein